MNSSQFMDKQIMDLSRSQNNNDNNDLYDLLNPPPQSQTQPQEGGIGAREKKEFKEEILPNYDFQPIRPLAAAASQSHNLEAAGTRVWNSADSKPNSSSSSRNYVNVDPNGSSRFTQARDANAYDEVMLSEIDQTMKKHADNLLHALDGVSARLSQMESRTRNLENLVDDLKLSVENNQGSNDGKMRQLENILREVQTGVQVMRDKQEIAEAQLHLAKLQTSKGDQNQNISSYSDFVQPAASPLPQSTQPLQPQVALPQPPQQVPALSPPNAPPPSIHQNPPPLQLSTQLPQHQIPPTSQRESYFPPSSQFPEATHQQYQPPSQQPPPAQQPPSAQQLQMHPPPQPQHYQSTPQLPHYSQSSQPPQHQAIGPVNRAPQLQPPASHHPDEIPYMPTQNYPPGIRQSPSVSQPPSGVASSQQFYAQPAPPMYEPQVSRPNSGFSPGYGPSSGPNFSDSYPYTGSPKHYSSSTVKPPQYSSSPSAPSGGGSGYPRLPTAQILPQALPTATSVGGGQNSGETGNRVPIDDVVDKVSTMGFSREQVRATVKKLTENGQSVDLNVVLDKLMNDGEVQQPPKGWFGQ